MIDRPVGGVAATDVRLPVHWRGPTVGATFAPMESPVLDHDSTTWLRELTAPGREGEVASARLHGLLLRVARSEANRRRSRLPDRVQQELDDHCLHAASDALMAVLRKLSEFRGESRFTTWATKFAIFEISSRLRRQSWRERLVEPDESVWDRLEDRVPGALAALQDRELRRALKEAVQRDLTERQRLVFQAVLFEETPIDVLAERMETNRGAIYKTLHDARRKLRQVLEGSGYGRRGA